MKIISLKLKTLNIVILFLNRLKYISAEEVKRELKIKEKKKVALMDLPDLRILSFPISNKQIVIETNRFIVYDLFDNKKKNIDRKGLFKYFSEIFKLFADEKMKAFGFNYEILVELDRLDYKNLVEKKITNSLKSENILATGRNITYLKNKIKYRIDIDSRERNQLAINFNVHYEVDKPPSVAQLDKNLLTNFSELKRIITNLF